MHPANIRAEKEAWNGNPDDRCMNTTHVEHSLPEGLAAAHTINTVV
jgi:hypothetical protein